MSWKELIQANSSVWHGVQEYARERIGELTAVCITPESSEADIRAAQASIQEMHRLLALPEMIRAEAQIRGRSGSRKEY